VIGGRLVVAAASMTGVVGRELHLARIDDGGV
jgi:hypothetical protein